jgi:hypothetical protein
VTTLLGGARPQAFPRSSDSTRRTDRLAGFSSHTGLHTRNAAMTKLAGFALLVLSPWIVACASGAHGRNDPPPPAVTAEAEEGVAADVSALPTADLSRLADAELIALVFADRAEESASAYAELFRRGPAAIPSVVAALEREPPYAQQERIRSFLLLRDLRSCMLEFEVARGVALCYLLEAYRAGTEAPAFAPQLSGRGDPTPQDAAIAAYVAWGRALSSHTPAALAEAPAPLAGVRASWYGSR